MAGPRESKLQAAVVEAARTELGIESVKMRSRAWPDYQFFVHGGRPCLIEFKRPGESARKNQRLKIFRLRKLGYNVHLCDDKDEALGILRAALKQAGPKPVQNRAEMLAEVKSLLNR